MFSYVMVSQPGAATRGDRKRLRKTKVIISTGVRGRRHGVRDTWGGPQSEQEAEDRSGQMLRPWPLLGFTKERQDRSG